MECHQTMATGDPGVQKLAAYAKSGEIIPWVRIYQLPSFVNFSHKTHTTHGNTCQECHGQVAQRDRLFQEEDISMAACLNCHRAKKASVECNTCHTLPE
jgi:Cytochrome c7 and related cytochrome c